MIYPIRRHHLYHLSICMLATALGPACHAEVPQGWKTECVGRYQLALPGDVEVALTKPSLFPFESSQSPYRFEDGKTAPYSGMTSGGGGVFITPLVTAEDVREIVKRNQSVTDKAKSEYIKDGDLATAESLARLPLTANDAYAWRAGNAIHLYLLRGNRIVNWNGGDLEEYGKNKAFMLKLIDSFRLRALFEIPKESGMCIPYGFIPDDGKAWQKAGVTMRLKDHPDVEIFFKEEPPSSDPRMNLSARDELAFFWGRRYGAAKEVRLKWPPYRNVNLDNREGASTFVDIIRKDGSLDFGYAAYVNGDPQAVSDKPNLMLFIIRTASRAKDKPVSERELKDIAQQIAASIKRRHP